jgi:hypothetical protein
MTAAPHPNPHRFNSMTTPAKFRVSGFQPSRLCPVHLGLHRFIRSLWVAPLLLVAVLWSLPNISPAQIYVSQGTTVGKYDATTGAVINANFITGLSAPRGLALSGNVLFEVNQGGNTVGQYDATTGATLNANFITVNDPHAIAMSGGNLFVTNGDSGNPAGAVGKYNATTGATINANFITGLTTPIGLAISGANLFVADVTDNTVGKYDATTGATINANFVTGLSGPVGIWVSGNTLFVSNSDGTTVGKYDATTGAAMNANFITGLSAPAGIWGSGNVLLVSSYSGNKLGQYDATTGATINANFITGLTTPSFIIVASGTSGNSPTVTTTAASGITATSATLNGTVNPNGLATTAQFEYGLTTSYGNTAGVTLSPNNGTTAQNASAGISGLQAGQTYHYRLSATNSAGTGLGGDVPFVPVQPRPEIAVEQPVGTNLINGSSSISFGNVAPGGSSRALTFTVKNLGTTNLTGLALAKDGASADQFTVGALGTTTLAAGASTTFAVTFAPGAAGARTAAIHIASNDADENPFDITLTGTGKLSVSDAIDQPGLAITFGGSAPWFAQTAKSHDGIDAARSGTITDSQESWMQATLTGPGTLTYLWQVSSAEGDYLEFYVDGVRFSRVHGNMWGSWEKKTYSIAAGTRTVKWRYIKNGSTTWGTDAGLVDQVIWTATVPPLGPGELVVPRIAIAGGNVNLTVQPSVAERSYQLQVSDTLAAGSWQDVGVERVGDGNNLVISVPYVPAVSRRFYRLALFGVSTVPTAPEGCALIPAGPFQMGQTGIAEPVHTVQVSAFYTAAHQDL